MSGELVSARISRFKTRHAVASVIACAVIVRATALGAYALRVRLHFSLQAHNAGADGVLFAMLLNAVLVLYIMESWIVFGLISPLFYSIVNILDKYVLGKRIKNVYAFSAVMGLFYLLIAALVIYFRNAPHLGRFMLPIMFLGLLSGIAHLTFFNIMRHAEISRVVGIMYAYPVFVAVFSVLLLGEHIAFYKYAGVVLAAAGAILLATRKDHLRWKLTPVLGHVLFIALLLSVIDIGDKYILHFVRPFEFYPVYLGTAALVMTAPLLKRKVRTNVMHSLSSVPLVGLIAAVGFAGTISFLTAVSGGPIAVVSALATLQPLFVFVFALFISIFEPRILKETLQRDAVFHKFLSVVCIMVGVLVLMM